MAAWAEPAIRMKQLMKAFEHQAEDKRLLEALATLEQIEAHIRIARASLMRDRANEHRRAAA